MKKTLLLSGLVGVFFTSNGQKLALYEEFSGENCGPCAAANPTLMATLNAAGNSSKVLLIKYQSPIPSAGPIYNENTTDVNARTSYYNVPFAPYGRMNGDELGTGQNAGHVSFATQAAIDAAALEVTPFNLTIGTPTITGSNFSVTVTVSATAAANFTNLKLRFALVEDMYFATPPGTNGETEFHHVMRDMYPSADGQAVQSTFTVGQTQSFTVTGVIPSYVSAENDRMFIAWVQNDDNKKVLQAAKSAPIPKATNAIASNGISVPTRVVCGATGSFSPVVVIKNTGSATLTSAKIYTKVGATGAWSATPQSWAGSLAAGATANVTISSAITAPLGQTVIYDSVASPNNQVDAFAGNNVTSTTVYVLNDDVKTLPQANDFEAVNDSWSPAPGTQGATLIRATVASFLSSNVAGSGYNSSATAIVFPCFVYGSGVDGYYALPKSDMSAGAKALDFYVSYCQYQAENDKLEVVYSTDCGASWTSIWSKAGSTLSTKSASTNLFKPNNNNDWRMESVDVTNVPAGARLAFKGTSNYGNNIWIDNVNLRTGAAVGINEFAANSNLSVYPNPATDLLNVELDLVKGTEVSFGIYNTVGQLVNTPVVSQLNSGKTVSQLNTSNLAAGVYFLHITSATGNLNYKFTKK